MAVVPNEANAHKISTETAELFVKSFYRSVDNHVQRANVANYFQEKLEDPSVTVPYINYNGSVLNAGDFQKMVEEFPPTTTDLASLDAQVLNPTVHIEGRTEDDAKKGKNISIVLTTSGTMFLGRKEENNKRVFSDVFILAPNPKVGPGRRERGQKEWLIQSYNSRVVSS